MNESRMTTVRLVFAFRFLPQVVGHRSIRQDMSNFTTPELRAFWQPCQPCQVSPPRSADFATAVTRPLEAGKANLPDLRINLPARFSFASAPNLPTRSRDAQSIATGARKGNC